MEHTEHFTAFLNEIYRNAESGISAINALLPKTNDDRLSKDLQNQLHDLRAIEAEAVRKLKNCGEAPKGQPLMARMGMRMGIEMNTAMNRSSSRLAELMIKGNNMGIIDLNRAINRYSAANANAGDLANRLLTSEQAALNTFKSYL
ncbi:MAG: hypothetical protein IJC88_02480 [Oscillospiraceae bacterium]|nr:hypothetical protein [Oscillospiraceae bacterium]